MSEEKKIEIFDAEKFPDCHPALSFTIDGRALVTVKRKIFKKVTRQNRAPSYDMGREHWCILYDGKKVETFWYNKKELFDRELFYERTLDIQELRWEISDIDKFTKEQSCNTFSEMFEIIRDKYEEYYDFADKRMYWVMTYFTMYTYFFPIFTYAPVIHFTGEFRTGKSKLCQLIYCMAFNPLNSSNISASTIYRIVQGCRAVVILDEGEDVDKQEQDSKLNMVLAGINKSGKAYRQEKDTNENFATKAFELFSPKIIANISGIEKESLNSRVIRVRTIGTTDASKKNKDVDIESYEWQEVRNKLYRIALMRHNDIEDIKNDPTFVAEITKLLSGRWFNIWFGILSLAKACHGDLYNEMTKIASELCVEIEGEFETDSAMRVLLEKLLEIYDKDKKDIYTVRELFDFIDYDLKCMLDMNDIKKFGKVMSRCGIRSKPKRINGEVVKVYSFTPEQINDTLKRIKEIPEESEEEQSTLAL